MIPKVQSIFDLLTSKKVTEVFLTSKKLPKSYCISNRSGLPGLSLSTIPKIQGTLRRINAVMTYAKTVEATIFEASMIPVTWRKKSDQQISGIRFSPLLTWISWMWPPHRMPVVNEGL